MSITARLIASILCLATSLSPVGGSVAHAADPYLAGTLAELFPGAGYAYAGDASRAAFSAGLIVPLALPYYWTTPTFATKSFKANLHTVARNAFGFTVYDSFQAAMSEEDRKSQVVPIPRYTFHDLYFAPFQSRTYASRAMWVPIGLAALGASGRIAANGISPDLTLGRALVSIPLIFALSLAIGVGEESEFRGFQYPAFAKLTGSRDLGNVIQAVSFGTCHTRWGLCTTPYATAQLFRATGTIDSNREYVSPSSPSDGGDISDLQYLAQTALFGLFQGYLVQTERDGLLQAVTAHAFMDAILITSDLLTTNGTGRIYLSLTLPAPI